MQLSKNASDIFRNAGLLLFLILLGVFVSQTFGLFKAAFSDTTIFTQFAFYGLTIVASAILLIIIFVMEFTINKDEQTYGGNSLIFNSPNEAPSIWGQAFKFLKNPIHVGLLSIIIFSILGIFLVLIPNQTFVGIGTLGQQFTPTQNIVFSAILVSIAENMGLAAILATTIFLIRFYCRKYGWGKFSFIALSYFGVAIISVVYALLNHYGRYGGQEQNLQSVFGFWLMSGLLTVSTGSFIPAWIMHFINNLFFSLRKFFASETLIIGLVFVIILFIVLEFLIFFRKKKVNFDRVEV